MWGERLCAAGDDRPGTGAARERAFDFIVVGAGSAGAVVATRLSADPATRVLLLEAGAPDHPLGFLPASFGPLIANPAANWLYESEPERNTHDRVIPVPRGKLLGGSSAINGLVFVRVQALDYDIWAQLGNRGWSFEVVLPILRRLENFEHGADPHRSRGGPINVCEAYDQSPLYDALFDAAREIGVRVSSDYNDASQESICQTQTSIRDGRRSRVAATYLRPARVRAEVVVSSGAVATPQLLEQSGIGRPEVLGPLGIEVHHPLADVGKHLRDHINTRTTWRLSRPELSYNARMKGLGRAAALDPMRESEVVPGPVIETDDEILDYVRANAQTAYHPIGTCRMGTGVSGNTNAPSIMIGEKAADMIRANHR